MNIRTAVQIVRRPNSSPRCRRSNQVACGAPELRRAWTLNVAPRYGVEGFANANTALGPNGGTRKFGTFQAIPGQDVTSDLFLKLSGRQFDTETCFGDSGGPVFANGYLVAVVSFGQSWVCASMGYYTRVDVESVSTWIATTIAEINSD